MEEHQSHDTSDVHRDDDCEVQDDGLLDHEDDDPFFDIPELGPTDEEMLAMSSDKDFLKMLAEAFGTDPDDPKFVAEEAAFRRQLEATIAANREEYENG